LAAADLAGANLETTVVSEGPAAPKRYSFAIPPERLAAIRALGVRAVNLANNHAGDFGAIGLKTTMEALRAHELASFGAGLGTASAVQSWNTQVKGIAVAFLGVSLSDADLLPAGERSSGLAVLPRHEREIAEALSEARRSAACVIVVPHWGTEGSKTVDAEQHRWARWFVQHGADAVVGSGPHLVQQHESVEGAPVFYSTGNLWFSGRWSAEARRAGVAFLGLDAEGRIVGSRFEIYPPMPETSSGIRVDSER
jgi:poly-gamma-glutamate synthesis protein (capsule biosynthesis protein)